MSSLSDDDFFDRVFSPVFGEGAGAEEEEEEGFFVGVVEDGMGGRNRPSDRAHAQICFSSSLGPPEVARKA